MSHYILKRMLLMIPTLFFIVLINFIIVQIAPGGPVEQAIQQIQNAQGLGTGASTLSSLSNLAQYQGARGLSPKMIDKIKPQIKTMSNHRLFVIKLNFNSASGITLNHLFTLVNYTKNTHFMQSLF